MVMVTSESNERQAQWDREVVVKLAAAELAAAQSPQRFSHDQVFADLRKRLEGIADDEV